MLGGKKPQRRGPTGEEQALGSAVGRIDEQRSRLGGVANLYAHSLRAGKKSERSDFIGAGAADVAQAAGAAGPVTSNNTALENALRRGKGLSRIVGARSNQFDSQLLRDRVAYAGAIASRRGTGLRALGGAANIAEGLAANQQNVDMQNAATKANTLGSLVGIGAGFARNGNSFSFLPGNKGHEAWKIGRANQGMTTGDPNTRVA
jgi:hypothetical protein